MARRRVFKTMRRSVTALILALAFIAAGPAAVAATAGISVPTLPPLPAPPFQPAAPPPAAVSGSTHLPFENCSARNVTLTVTLPRHSFVQPSVSRVPVIYQVTLHNGGDTPCGRPTGKGPATPAGGPPLSRVLYVGPCGALSSVVYNAFGVNVYPGSAVFSCPAFGGTVYLPAQGTLTTTSRWIGVEYLASPGGTPQYRPAPPGLYHLVVGTVPAGSGRARVVTVPFTLVAAAP